MIEGVGEAVLAEVSAGSIEYADRGSGPAVLFVHGSPGGFDQGELMTRFVVAAGFRVVIPSRPGYLGTPLHDDNATPDQQAGLELALMDALGISRFGVLCWSGGGPSAYRLVAEHPDRVSALVTLAAVSGPYTFAGGLEARLMEGEVGRWLIAEMARHAPKSLIRSTVGEEGDLTRAELKALTEQIWEDETKRQFVLDLAETVAGRKLGLDNDHHQFPQIHDLGLERIQAPTLLVHGTVDTDVPPGHSESALARVPGARSFGWTAAPTSAPGPIPPATPSRPASSRPSARNRRATVRQRPCATGRRDPESSDAPGRTRMCGTGVGSG